MTSATDNRTTELRVKRLRELLDERGIEHYDHENGDPLRVLEKAEEPATSWRVDGASYCAVPDNKGTFDIWIDHCTPEQAIAATLGSGTCSIVKTLSDSDYVDDWRYRCSECGCFIPVNERDPDTGDVINAANYCPNCGRRVIA